MNEHTLKSLGQMSLDKQLLFVESYLPDAWEYLHDIASAAELPIFDDNDDMVTCGGDTPQDANKM